MKRFLLTTSLLLSPTFALAAFDDATLTTDTNITVGGYTLNITGSSAVIETIIVNASDFSVTLASGSSIKVTSPDLNRLDADSATNVTSVCTGSESSVTVSYSGGGTITRTITPSATLCATQSQSSGGGGGSGSRARTPTVAPTPTVTPPVPAPSVVPSTFTRALSPGDSGADVKALQIFLNARGFTIAVSGPGSSGNETNLFGELTRLALAKFQASQGIYPAVGNFGPLTMAAVSRISGLAAAPSPVSSVLAFTRDLAFGDDHPEVKLLQQYLNSHGFPIASSGPGSAGRETTLFGNLTRDALMKFQTAKGISPAVGFFGPVTRAYFLSH